MKNLYTIIVGTFILCGYHEFLAAQTQLPHDPYNNPALWTELQKNPHDGLLWQKYAHKQWTELSDNERVKIKMWIQQMWLHNLTGAPHTNPQTVTQSNTTQNTQSTSATQNTTSSSSSNQTVSSTSKLSKDQKKAALLAKPEVQNFMKDLEESFMAESLEMEELKTDLFENFFIIESVLADEFEALGEKYTYYKQKYPQGNYSESRWMSEQEQRLKKLKSQKLEQMKEAFLERQLN